MGRVKHIPQRTCVACRQATAKRGLIRRVRTPAGGVEIDATGKRAGRGAYLCADSTCWTRALTRGQLGQALRTTISTEDKAALAEYGQSLPATAGEAPAQPVASATD